MISPELLRRYPFFAPFTEADLREFAMIADEFTAAEGEELFEECGDADTLYLLLDGGIDLYYKSEEEFHPKESKEFEVGVINPGEVFAISAMIEPFKLNATARVSQDSKFVKIDAVKLRAFLEENPKTGYLMMQQITKALMERLASTRVQLAAAWA